MTGNKVLTNTGLNSNAATQEEGFVSSNDFCIYTKGLRIKIQGGDYITTKLFTHLLINTLQEHAKC